MEADKRHALFLERLGDSHEKRVVEALSSVEQQIAQLVSGAPLRESKLFDLEWAVAARTDLKSIIDSEFLGTVQQNIDSYSDAVESAKSMLGKYGDFVGVESAVVRALKKQSFQGFENIASTFLDDLSNEVYQNTLSGRNVAESVQSMRQKINGVYAQSDQVDIQRLVNIANAGGEAAEEAISKLHSIYAADKLGNNMRRYASQLVHDSLMQFDAAVVTKSGKDSGADAWLYFGSTINDTRKFCRDHLDKVYTEEQIREIWSGNWAGKAAGDPFIVRGGYNCRHHWRPVFTDLLDDVPVEDDNTTKPVYEVPESIVDFSRIDEFAVAMNQLSDDQVNLVNKLPPINSLEAPSRGGAYYMSSQKKIVVDPTSRGGSIVRHEYGHHVDFELGRKVGNAGVFGLSATDVGFLEAFDRDRKALGFNKTATFGDSVKSIYNEIYDFEEIKTPYGTRYKKTPKNPELGNFGDIVDALSYGKAIKQYGGFGHGVQYFKRKGTRQQEAFANLFALRNTKDWSLVQEKMPNMAARFDEIIREYLDEGT